MRQGYGRRSNAVDSYVRASVKHASVGSFVLMKVGCVLKSKCQLPLRVRVGRTNNFKVQLLVQLDGSFWHARSLTEYSSKNIIVRHKFLGKNIGALPLRCPANLSEPPKPPLRLVGLPLFILYTSDTSCTH